MHEINSNPEVLLVSQREFKESSENNFVISISALYVMVVHVGKQLHFSRNARTVLFPMSPIRASLNSVFSADW